MISTEQDRYDRIIERGVQAAISLTAHDHGIDAASASRLTERLGLDETVGELINTVAAAAARSALSLAEIERPATVRTEVTDDEREAGNDTLITIERDMLMRLTQIIQVAVPDETAEKIRTGDVDQAHLDEIATQGGDYITGNVYNHVEDPDDGFHLNVIAINGEETRIAA